VAVQANINVQPAEIDGLSADARAMGKRPGQKHFWRSQPRDGTFTGAQGAPARNNGQTAVNRDIRTAGKARQAGAAQPRA
jgi:hypothetical protein